jgi:hypothetical protein
VGEGLLVFTDVDDAAAGIEEITRGYPRHARKARELAVERFDSDVVLGRLLERVGTSG